MKVITIRGSRYSGKTQLVRDFVKYMITLTGKQPIIRTHFATQKVRVAVTYLPFGAVVVGNYKRLPWVNCDRVSTAELLTVVLQLSKRNDVKLILCEGTKLSLVYTAWVDFCKKNKLGVVFATLDTPILTCFERVGTLDFKVLSETEKSALMTRNLFNKALKEPRIEAEVISWEHPLRDLVSLTLKYTNIDIPTLEKVNG